MDYEIAQPDKHFVFTPDYVAEDAVAILRPSGIILDPCLGDGSFYNAFPSSETKMWCELDKGKDFFSFDERVDWVIGNPPYSIYLEWLQHSFKIAHDVAYLVPVNKVFQRWVVMDLIAKYGGIRHMIVYGSGIQIGMPFGFSVAMFHFKKGWKGDTSILFRRTPHNKSLNDRLENPPHFKPVSEVESG